MTFRKVAIKKDSFGTVVTTRCEYDNPEFNTIMQDLQGCLAITEPVMTLQDGRRMRVDRYSDDYARMAKIIRRVLPAGSGLVAGKRIFFLPADSPQSERGYGDWYALTPEALAKPLTSEIDPMPMEQRIADARELHSEILRRFAQAVPRNHKCAGWSDGCRTMVTQEGSYCARCAHDER